MHIGEAEPRPIPPNPVIVAPKPNRPSSTFPAISLLSAPTSHGSGHQHSGEEEIVTGTEVAEGDDEQPSNIAGRRLRSHSRSRSTRSRSRSRGRSSRGKKSAELVESDEEMEDVVEMRTTKGKGKQKEVDEDYMEVNEPADPPSPVRPVSKRARKPETGHAMVKRSSSRPPVDEGENSTDGVLASVACMLCKKRRRDCLFVPGKFACVACQRAKAKCSGVPETWRSGPRMKEDVTRPTGPSKSQRRSASRGPAPVSKKSRQRSTSQAPRQNDNPAAPKRSTSRAPRQNDNPAAPKRSTSRAPRQKDKPGAPKKTMNPESSQAGRAKPSSTAIKVPPMGQVPSNYVYLLSNQGQDVTTGIRLETGEAVGGNEVEGREGLEARLLKVEEENVGLKKQVEHLTTEVQRLTTTVGVLMASYNGHTTLLETHRLALNDMQRRSAELEETGFDIQQDSPPLPIPPPVKMPEDESMSGPLD